MTDVKVISSVEEFLQTFKVGDKFWSMSTLHGRPYDISGPREVVNIFRDTEGECRIVYTDHGSGYMSSSRHPDYVSDKVKNGVFMSRSAAFAYFRQKYAEHITDPELIREYERNVATRNAVSEMVEEILVEEFAYQGFEEWYEEDFTSSFF